MSRTELQYETPAVPEGWAGCRNTHDAVAMAIWAISDSKRSPQSIWDNPTDAESDHVKMAVCNYVMAGVFDAEDDNRYPWGCEALIVETEN